MNLINLSSLSVKSMWSTITVSVTPHRHKHNSTGNKYEAVKYVFFGFKVIANSIQVNFQMQ